jgi:endonuclease/exonuclease/phosphatase family metal-dependent hydrolase
MTIGDSFLIIEWNIQFGLDIAGAIAALHDIEELHQPALVFLQEMDRSGTEAVADALGYEYVYASATAHPKTSREFGNAILSANEFERVEVVPLPHAAGRQVTPRIALWAATTVGGETVDVCSVHTETPALGLAKRGEQFDIIAAGIRARPSTPVLVGGDFNTAGRRSTRLLIETMDAGGAEHLSEQAGWSLQRGTRRFTLDHVFARGFLVHDAGVVRGLTASDHAPMWLRVERSANPAEAPDSPSA